MPSGSRLRPRRRPASSWISTSWCSSDQSSPTKITSLFSLPRRLYAVSLEVTTDALMEVLQGTPSHWWFTVPSPTSSGNGLDHGARTRVAEVLVCWRLGRILTAHDGGHQRAARS